ncbi:histone-like nucleoid-structuring protein Lsr2 [Streptomyces sp. NRRL S-31]|uniref:Lsr2 family DNA-binding protein n=1 Tax=Streptomyces sp. NRRL S-31 TaxID=1463898 RepID=UPI0020A68D2D|nr:histone-like nucleoid-structuring protein Lsr2 [Streptomyces sp. NRRL S-31]
MVRRGRRRRRPPAAHRRRHCHRSAWPRNWARANGYDVPIRGRIPAEVRHAWELAHESS